MTNQPEPNQLGLAELIEALEAEDPNRVVPIGFHRPHSYRGYYEDLAFEIARDVEVGDMLAAARSALGATFTGWKGGDYQMRGSTSCWLVLERGDIGESIGEVFLSLLLAASPSTDGAAQPEIHIHMTGGEIDPVKLERALDQLRLRNRRVPR